MLDVNAEAEKALNKLSYKVAYYYPEEFNNLPVMSFYNISETPDFSCDNIEAMQRGTVVIDIWAEAPQQCGDIGIKVNEIMTADGWGREFSRDLEPVNGIYHRTTRYTKIFNL